jgi:hypothetical protein
MALKFAVNNSLSAVTSLPTAVPTGSMTFIKEQTASSSNEVDFNNGSGGVVLDSTYSVYKFVFFDINPSTDSTQFAINLRNGSTAQTKTGTFFYAQHGEDGNNGELVYSTAYDLAQSTGDQRISEIAGNGSDECISGYMFLFNPSSTTFVKHYLVETNTYVPSNRSTRVNVAGYANTTSAIDSVRFKMVAGQFDGTIKMYGVK